MKWLGIALLWVSFAGKSQTLEQFNQARYQLDKKLMLTLGSWSAANALVSGYGWATTENEARYFHQMNVFWSGVNLALAVPGYLKANKAPGIKASFSQTLRSQIKTEKVFLFNTALDVFYITGGFYLKQRALLDAENYHRYRGWGNAVILQGGFLFLFDLTATLLHTQHRNNQLNRFFDRVSLAPSGLGLNYQLGVPRPVELNPDLWN